ncbi:hypothetical protein ACROYT_G031039 [Oculina patagonica]
MEKKVEEPIPPQLKEELSQQLSEAKESLEKIYEYKTKGSILWSKTRWYNEGEKNSSYFFNLEKRHFKRKVLCQLRQADNTTLTSDHDILQECVNFYSDLYSSRTIQNNKEDLDFFPRDNSVRLDEDCKDSCEGLLSANECLSALKTMESNKSPGSDGFPAEFYKFFWNDISTLFVNAINCSFQKGLLSVTQRQGIVSLLPKKDKNPILLKNWRPITLLNCDYKIAAKAIGNRIKRVLPKIIDNDQSGFLKGRSIAENILLIDGIINFADNTNKPGLLMFVDFEKAFDSIEWSFIERALIHFGFGPSLVNWFRLFYKDVSSAIQNNGWVSEHFILGRGVRQGCPMSPYLFIIAAEILANFIRRDKDIKGFETNEVEHKLSQYADDTTLILDGSEGSFLRAVAVLDGFHIISGLKVNYEKTKVLWVGSAKEREPIKCDKSEISWVKGKVFALGIWFATDRKTMLRCNYEVRIKKIESVIESWQFRRLSLIGKITIIKSLLVSQLVYILTPLTTSVEALQKVNKMFFDFLWDGKGDKVKRIFITKDYKEGGLKMIDINKFNQSLKVSWIQKYLDPTNDGKWKFVFEDSLKKHGGRDIFTCNLHKDDIPTLGVCNPFVPEALEAWAELHFTDVTDITDVNVGDQIIWYNSLIRINDRPVFHKHWFNHGICKISHLLDENGTLLRYDELRIKFPELKWFESFAVLSAIRSFIRKLHNPQTPDNNIMKGVSLADLTSKSKINHFVYTSLLKREKIPPIGSQVKWLRDLHVQNDCERGGNSVEVKGGQKTTKTAAQLGLSVAHDAGTGGGGGSFVYTTRNELLLAAGGGGGASGGYNGVDGQSGTSGKNCVGKDSSKVRKGGTGGQPGECNTVGGNYHGGVGAGWFAQGCARKGIQHGERGGSRAQGWTGGQAGRMNSGNNGGPSPGAVGGFGGGGGGSEDQGASGGGGGYSGGGSGITINQAGGGGGSYCSGQGCSGDTGGNSNDVGLVKIVELSA